jgi:hypothetical protein
MTFFYELHDDHATDHRHLVCHDYPHHPHHHHHHHHHCAETPAMSLMTMIARVIDGLLLAASMDDEQVSVFVRFLNAGTDGCEDGWIHGCIDA